MGGCCLFVQGGKLNDKEKSKIKYIVALDGRRPIKNTQQSTKNMRVQWGRDRTGCATGGEHRGSAI